MSTAEINQDNVCILLGIFAKKAFKAGLCEIGSMEHEIIAKCESLFKLDYSLIQLDNVGGSLCSAYPSRIFIPEYERSHNKKLFGTNSSGLINSTSFTNGQSTSHFDARDNNQQQQQQQQQQQCTIYEDQYDVSKIRELAAVARFFRCRKRFAVPVIMCKGKYICRSATLSVWPETYGRQIYDKAYEYIGGSTNGTSANIDEENNDSVSDDSLMNNASETSHLTYEEDIMNDIQLLKVLNVSTIVDLMVEHRKVKYFVTVSSSEKVNENYKDFNIISLPYPGCEFFKSFRENNYMAEKLYFDWNQSFIDVTVNFTRMGPVHDLGILWSEYKNWDLVVITQNYLKAILKYVQDGTSGILIHCISGWDRTPLFISLLRLSLWANGLIHQSLDAVQMTFFTLAYDWYLFGHQLNDRLTRGEEIMFFCFHILKYITGEEFNIMEQRKRIKTMSTNSNTSNTSPATTKSDSCEEILKEELLMNVDEDSSGSNLSNCDSMFVSIATEGCIGTSSNNITSRSPNLKRTKTSPITVPGANNSRQRYESTSSIGSWQIINDAGSLDSNSAKDIQGINPLTTIRSQRLHAVRNTFVQAYAKAIGLKFQEGTSRLLETISITISEGLNNW